jgi:hypothetical protein
VIDRVNRVHVYLFCFVSPSIQQRDQHVPDGVRACVGEDPQNSLLDRPSPCHVSKEQEVEECQGHCQELPSLDVAGLRYFLFHFYNNPSHSINVYA